MTYPYVFFEKSSFFGGKIMFLTHFYGVIFMVCFCEYTSGNIRPYLINQLICKSFLHNLRPKSCLLMHRSKSLHPYPLIIKIPENDKITIYVFRNSKKYQNPARHPCPNRMRLHISLLRNRKEICVHDGDRQRCSLL